MSLEIKKNLITHHYLTDHVPLLEFLREHSGKVKVSATDSTPGYLINKLIESNVIGLVNLEGKLQVIIKDNSITSSYLATDALSLSKVTNNLITTDLENNFVGINTLPQYTLDVNGKIQTTEGVVLIAPNGSKWLLKVDNNGVLYTEQIS